MVEENHRPAQRSGPNREDAPDCGQDAQEAEERLPDIDFGTFVLSLASSALIHLGQLPNEETGRMEQNLPLARQSIDILGMLQEKTRGNLTNEEDHLLTELLYDLRLKYVAACRSRGHKE